MTTIRQQRHERSVAFHATPRICALCDTCERRRCEKDMKTCRACINAKRGIVATVAVWCDECQAKGFHRDGCRA